MITTEKPATLFYFKSSDADILKHLVAYRYLQPKHFQILTGRNIVSLRRRLRQLHENGYVQRLSLPLAREALTASPPDQFVYYLGRRGVDAAKHYGYADENERYNPEKKIALLIHDLTITEVHLALERAAQATPNLTLSLWEQRLTLLLDRVEHKTEVLSVNPDAFFGLTNKDRPEGENTTYFFLEMVLARETEYAQGESYFMRKMRAYFEYYRQQKCRERWGVTNFRVITVAPTKERAQNLCRKLKDAGLLYKRYWFAAQSDVLHDPPKILEPIFITPKDFEVGTLHSLLN
jgi:hypothetical protein